VDKIASATSVMAATNPILFPTFFISFQPAARILPTDTVTGVLF
jgi:hypothetical protein